MPIEYNKVTWYSKLLAVIVFLATFAIAFCLGYQYVDIKNIERGSTPCVYVSDLPDNNNTGEGSVMPVGKNLTLGIGQSGVVDGLKITFNALVQDSRCPIDVQCIQAGAVTANVTFTQGPHTETRNMPSDEVPIVFELHRISITEVGPPRKSTQETSPGEYRITFKVEQIWIE